MSDLTFQYFKSKVDESGRLTGYFLIQALEAGQGLTIGNALRRVLLSNLEGTAITALRIPGIAHEFSTIPGVREDLLEIILNLKQIILKTERDETFIGEIDVEGPGVITASNIQFGADVTIINPNHYITTISENTHLKFTVKANKGYGYQFAEQTNLDDAVDFIAMDAIFMPVLNVNYKINNVYVGYSKTMESLVLEITTNGSISPEDALRKAAQKLTTWFNVLTKEHNEIPEPEPIVQTQQTTETILIEELQLPVRAYNCLKRAGINSVNELMSYSQEEIREIKNFGKKSAQEVFQALQEKFDIVLPELKA